MAALGHDNVTPYTNPLLPTVTKAGEALDAVVALAVALDDRITFSADPPATYDVGEPTPEYTHAVGQPAGDYSDEPQVLLNNPVVDPITEAELSVWSLFNGLVLEGEEDPSADTGVEAVEGSYFVQHDDAGATYVALWLKDDVEDTDWVEVETATALGEDDPIDGVASVPYASGSLWIATDPEHDDGVVVYVQVGATDQPDWTALTSPS